MPIGTVTHNIGEKRLVRRVMLRTHRRNNDRVQFPHVVLLTILHHDDIHILRFDQVNDDTSTMIYNQ
jgi:hypothetical protein